MSSEGMCYLCMAVMFTPPTWEVYLAIVVLVFFLFCSAYISASEAAFFSLSPRARQRLEDERKENVQCDIVLKLLSHEDRFLATILIVNNLVNVGVVVLSNFVLNSTLSFVGMGGVEFFVKTLFITFLLLLFGEILPKNIGMAFSESYIRFASRGLQIVYLLLSPLAIPLSRAVSSMYQRFSSRSDLSMDELGQALEITESLPEETILRGIVRFGDIEASEIMRPRIDVVAVEVKEKYNELKRIVLESGYSRIPVYEDTLDTVVGILYVKDLLPYLEAADDFNWVQLIRKVYFIPENKRINVLFHEFQAHHVHMAVVVDEYGGTSGILTLEDVIEEVFGEMKDESDAESRLYVSLGDGVYRIEGKMPLNDLAKLLNMKDITVFDAIRGEAETLGGLVLEILGRFPVEGEVVRVAGLVLTMDHVGKRRIESIHVEVPRDEKSK